MYNDGVRKEIIKKFGSLLHIDHKGGNVYVGNHCNVANGC